MLLTVIAFILVLGILILTHELGHFIVAKMAKVKVEEFAIGFPPKIYSWQRGETKYILGLLPIGGYVKMLGEDESSKDPRAYNNQTAGKRFAIGVAGVVMNFVLAWFLLSVCYTAGLAPITLSADSISGQKISTQIYIAEVSSDSAAEKAGIKAGDQVLGTDSVDFATASDLSNYTKSNSGKEITLKIKRDDTVVTKSVTLAADSNTPLGVAIVDNSVVRVVWYRAPFVALREAWGILKYTFSFFGGFIKQLFTTATISNDVGGPVAIFNLTGVAARAGIITLLEFMAMLSLNLALVNILPFPALDGGRAFFILLEKIFGKRILREEIEGAIHTIGFALLMIFILAVTYKDIVKLIHK